MNRCILLCLLAAGAFAQTTPLIYNRGVVNSASFMPPRLPGGAIAQGSMFAIFGARLGPTTPQQVSVYPLQTTLAGTSITVTKGSTTVNAIPVYVSAGQINAIMPSNAPTGLASIHVRTAIGVSNPMTVTIAPTAFGIFTATGTGIGPGILQNYISSSAQPINSPLVTAAPGQLLTLWGTGLGPVQNDTVAPSVASLPTQVEVFFGGVPATNIPYSGRTPCCASIDQIIVQVPAGAPRGCWVPVAVRTGGTTVSNFVSIAISDQQSASCLDPTNPYPFVTAGKHGAFLGLRVSTREDIGVKSPIDVVGDYSTAVAYSVPSSQFPFNPVFSYPPAGTCTVYTSKGDILRGDTLPGAVPAGGKPLNFGGAYTVSGPAGTKVIQNWIAAQPVNYLGGSITGNVFNNSLFLNPGSFQFLGPGGADAGAFSGTAVMPAPINWTNRDQIGVVDRSKPLSVNWTGGSGGQVAIIGFGVDLPTSTSTTFACIAPSGATSFTVPALALSNVAPSRPNPLQSKGVIYLMNVPDRNSATRLSSSGLDSAAAFFQSATGKTVLYQ